MSRGVQVFYTSDASTLPSTGDGIQLDDICIVKSDISSSMPRSIGSATVNSFLESDNFQSRVFRWNGVDTWVEVQNFNFTDEAITSNVTKIRKAHITDTRTYIKAIQDNKLNKYGDSYYNTHNLTNAVLVWRRDTDLARIYFGDYGADSQWLTFEFGDNTGSYTGDRLRFAYRSSGLFDVIVDILGDRVHIFKELFVDGVTTLNSNTTINADLHITGSETIDTNLYVDKLTTLNGAVLINGATTINNDLQVNGTISATENISTDLTLVSNRGTGVAPIQVASTTIVPNLNVQYLDGAQRTTGHTADNTGINADRLDGLHKDEILALTAHFTQEIGNYFLKGYRTVTPGAAKTYDSNYDIVLGKALKIDFNETSMYIPDQSDPNGATEYCACTCTCPCPCTCPCTGPCCGEAGW